MSAHLRPGQRASLFPARLGILFPSLLVLLSACSPPPPSATIDTLERSWACRTDAAGHETRCPCAVNDDLDGLVDGPGATALRLNAIEPLDFDKLARVTHLRALSVEADQRIDLDRMPSLRQIQTLTITVPTGGLAPLAELRSLEKLVLRVGNRPPREVERVDLAPLSALTSLRELDLEAVEVMDPRPLADLSRLERLALRLGEGADLAPLLRLSGLRELTLSGAPAQGLGALASLKRLRTLHLGPAYPHDPCANKPALEHEIDAPLKEKLGGVAIRHEGLNCQGEICLVDPSACPVGDGCDERRRRRRGRASARP